MVHRSHPATVQLIQAALRRRKPTGPPQRGRREVESSESLGSVARDGTLRGSGTARLRRSGRRTARETERGEWA